MFEKFSIRDIDSGGRGGEYTVQAGFGWTNGVALWVASTFGDKLIAPTCPDPLLQASILSSGSSSPGSGGKKNGAFQLSVARALFGLMLLVTGQQLWFM
jgi:alpha,alpha-trehalase